MLPAADIPGRSDGTWLREKDELSVLSNPIKQFNDAGEDKTINLTARSQT